MSRAVGVFSLGGTIAMAAGTGSGAVPRLGAAELVASVPGLAAGGIRTQVHDVRRLPGASVGFGDVTALLDAVEECLRAGTINGAVVTQGTDTIEETAWLLDLLHDGEAPIVVTGAMRHPGLAGADGPANLLAAVHVAADPRTRNLGVLVVFADDVYAARDVRKAHSTSVGAFQAANTGPIGHVSEDSVRVWHRPERRRVAGSAQVRRAADLARVAVLPMTLGQDEAVVRAVAGTVDGLVVAGFGVGHVPAHLAGVLGELAGRMPVVLASRIGAGPVAATTYGFEGSESDLLARGLVRAGYLDGYKSRLLLQVLLTAGADDEQIRRSFADLGGYDLPPASGA